MSLSVWIYLSTAIVLLLTQKIAGLQALSCTPTLRSALWADVWFYLAVSVARSYTHSHGICGKEFAVSLPACLYNTICFCHFMYLFV